MEPYLLLAKNLGSFAGQITESAIQSVKIEYAGDIADMNIDTLTSTIISSLLKPLLEDINMVNSLVIAKERGIKIEQIKTDSHGVYGSYIKVVVDTERQKRSLAGTVFSDRSARIIQIKDIDMEAKFGSHMIYITNNDKPGLVGKIGDCLGSQGVNIANFNFSNEKIISSIKNCEFNNLSSQEDTYGFDGNSETNKQKNQKFFHLGPKNKWQDILTDEVRNKVELLFENEMKEIGYLK